MTLFITKNWTSISTSPRGPAHLRLIPKHNVTVLSPPQGKSFFFFLVYTNIYLPIDHACATTVTVVPNRRNDIEGQRRRLKKRAGEVEKTGEKAGRHEMVHCPRAGPGRVEAIFAGPDPDPQGRATLSLALAPGRLDPGPVGSGQGRVRADPDPLIFISEQIFFF